MKLMEKMRQKRLGNKGFSLIELIIVIAIMAVLLGLVGTQIIPYLERSREAKDLQIVNSYCTAAVTAYTSHAEAILADSAFQGTDPVYVLVYDNSLTGAKKTIADEIKELTYSDPSGMTTQMTSKKGQNIKNIQITINLGNGTITAQAKNGTENVFEAVVSYIGK